MQYPIARPEIVEQALSLANELGFAARPEGNRPEASVGASCCIDAVGSLLQTVCSSVHQAKVGEIGTGAGVGAASNSRSNVVIKAEPSWSFQPARK